MFYYVFCALALFFAALDFKVILQGGISGAARIARHLWRMCFALFFAAGSFFLGQQKVMPVWMRGVFYVLAPCCWLGDLLVDPRSAHELVPERSRRLTVVARSRSEDMTSAPAFGGDLSQN